MIIFGLQLIAHITYCDIKSSWLAKHPGFHKNICRAGMTLVSSKTTTYFNLTP